MKLYRCSKRYAVIGLVCYLVLVVYMYQDLNGFSLFHTLVRGRQRFSSLGSRNASMRSDNVPYTPVGSTSSRPLIDKLVDWFLVTFGLDPESCISRQESHKYRKTLPYKPSGYLVSKLRDYEKLHERCGPYTEPYKATTRMLQTKSNHVGRHHENVNLNETCNYIIWKASAGLGNRMLSIASTFLYGLLTDRVLLVDFAFSSMGDLFCEPFHGSSWLLPKKLQLLIDNYSNEDGHTFESIQQRRSATKSSKVGHTFESIQQRRSATKSSSSTLRGNQQAPLLVILDLHSHTSDLKVFHCNDSQMMLNDVPIVILKSDLYYVPSLFMAPFFQEELRKLFPQNRVFSLLSHFLFHPSDPAWGVITRFYEAYLANVDHRVGLQIRLFDQDKAEGIHASYMKQILSCISSNKLLPGAKSNITTTKMFVEPKNLSTSSNSYKTAVLVASLHSVYAENLKKLYSSGDVNGHELAVHQTSHEEHQHSGFGGHNMKAWVDIYLLSMCDVIVTSADSTFGYVAQNLGGMMPWILDRPTAEHVPSPPCRQGLSMEPCFHNSPKFDCKTKSEIGNITSHFPFIRSCEDWIWNGVKLFPILS